MRDRLTVRGLLLVAMVALLVELIAAQAVPTRYRMTRTAPGQATLQTEWAASAIPCGLVRGPVNGRGFRFNDPADNARDCEYITESIFTNWQAGVNYRFTLAARANDVDSWSEESEPFDTRTPAIPGRPGGLRVAPPSADAVAYNGTVAAPPSGALGLEVVPIALEVGGVVWFGANRLTVPGYSVRVGDEVSFAFWRPAP